MVGVFVANVVVHLLGCQELSLPLRLSLPAVMFLLLAIPLALLPVIRERPLLLYQFYLGGLVAGLAGALFIRRIRRSQGP
jgi:hypothetical protein